MDRGTTGIRPPRRHPMRNYQISTLAAALLAIGLAGCDNNVETDDTLGATTPDTTMPDTMDDTMPDDSTALGGDMDPNSDPGTMADAGAIVAPTTLMGSTTGAPGPYLTDDDGRAIYFLEGDTDGSTCTGPCLELWPPVIAGDTTPGVDGDLKAGLLGTVERADGTTQLTYNGHPLYYYTRDTAAQVASGHDVTAGWGDWYLLAPDGTEVDDDVETN